MQADFFHFAHKIAKAAADGGLSVAQIAEIASSQFGRINC
jgi:hypothetical protein